ncbi:MAG: HNH endonuclease [Dehalococcoidales bacterium]|nr:HNH endonuclease [Dehalococcoidales bacterium]
MKKNIPNELLFLQNNLIVTTAVEKKLRKQAQNEIPKTSSEEIGDWFHRWGTLFFWASGYFVARSVSNAFFPLDEWTPLFWYVLLAWCFGLPWGNMIIIDKILAKPRKIREKKISSIVIKLAQERKKRIEESIKFYSSPEWFNIRTQVIKNKGKICAECGTNIIDDYNITVDHIKPRSKYPELSLSLDNLQVLCRSCNSRKGARDLY